MKTLDVSIRSRPADLGKIEASGRRAGFFSGVSRHSSQTADIGQLHIRCRTPPPTTSVSLLREEQWRIPEKLLFDVDVLLKGSFESGVWSWNGKDQIIRSSTEQDHERQLLHDFLGGLTSGCEAAAIRNFDSAGALWRSAFENVDHLVQGQYHDIVPNLIQKINDLNHDGYEELARELLRHIVACSQSFLPPNKSTKSIYLGLGDLGLNHMRAMEELIMQCFMQRFEFYLGAMSYNSFVMMMNHARRKLYHDPWVRLEDVLPPVDFLDRTYGASDRRALDVIGLRIEVAQKRKRYALVETEAPIMIQRSERILNDDWLRCYNLTRAWFDLGCAQYFLRKKGPAISSFDKALASDDGLRNVEACNIFDPERATIARYMENMRTWGENVD